MRDPGLYENVPAEQYHADDAVSKSLLLHVRESCAHARAALDGRLKPSTDAQEFGIMFHVATLEPDRFPETYIAIPAGMKLNRKDGIDWKAQQTKQIISADEYAQMLGMSQSIYSHPIAGPYMRAKGRNELSAWATHERTGLGLRCRFDRLLENHVVVDVKSTVSARPWKWVRDAAKFGFFIQSAFYQDMPPRLALPCDGFVFIAVEKTPPYNVLCCEFDAMSINKGRDEYERLLDLYKKCRDENHWPGYSETCELLTLPRWALTEKPFESAIPYELEEAT